MGALVRTIVSQQGLSVIQVNSKGGQGMGRLMQMVGRVMAVLMPWDALACLPLLVGMVFLLLVSQERSL